MRKHRNRRNGQYIQDRSFLRPVLFLIAMGLLIGPTMIGVNNIRDFFKGVGKDLKRVVVVENTLAQEEIKFTQPTWQEEVKMMIREAGLDVELATRIIQHESWWDPNNKHWNNPVYKNGKLVMPGHWDRGLWMFSKYYHAEVSDECAYDAICSTKEAIRVIKSRGWNEWVAYRYVK